MRDFYINFVNDLNPGRMSLFSPQRYRYLITLNILAQWPAYKNGAKTVLQLVRDNITLVYDG